jgi:hypothetical protein
MDPRLRTVHTIKEKPQLRPHERAYRDHSFRVWSTDSRQLSKPPRDLICTVTNMYFNWLRLQVLTAASMKKNVYWDVAPCSLVETDRSFRCAYSLHPSSHWLSCCLSSPQSVPSPTGPAKVLPYPALSYNLTHSTKTINR